MTVAVPVTGVSLDKATMSLTAGSTGTLTATITPENATNKNLTWTSDNEAVVAVSDGVVSAVAAGTANITVTTADGGKTATCVVTVTRRSSSSSRPSYPITTPDKTENGSVTVTPKSAKRGSVVTITGTPDAGYVLDELTVTDKDGKEFSLTEIAWEANPVNGWNAPKVNKNNEGNTITMGGQAYDKGFGVNAPSMLTFVLPEGHG